MRRLTLLCSLLCLPAFVAAPAARADFGLASVSASYRADSAGTPAGDAATHPYSFTTSFSLNSHLDPGGSGYQFPDEDLKDITIATPPGMVLDATAVPTCSYADFAAQSCPADTQAGTSDISLSGQDEIGNPVYALSPAPGSVATFGFYVVVAQVIINAGLDESYPYAGHATVADAPQLIATLASTVRLWGVPADHGTGAPSRPLLTLPGSCGGDLLHTFLADSWQKPGDFVSRQATAPGLGGCDGLGFDPRPAAAPSTDVVDSPSGFDFSIDVSDPGLADPTGTAQSDLKKAVVTLPEGIAVNPAAADGLGACSEAQLAAETADSDFGAGCPADSRIADVAVTTPLLDEALTGSIFIATPHDNPFHTLLAGYLVIKSPERGIAVKVPGKIEADPGTGQLTASFDQNPQLPFDHLAVRFKTGPHAPLITPPACGDYQIHTELSPWSGSAPVEHVDHFQIAHSPSGGACPTDPGGLPNSPSLDAGTVSPIAGAYSPFVFNLRREDGTQRFNSITLSRRRACSPSSPASETCPDAALSAAAAKAGARSSPRPPARPPRASGTVTAAPAPAPPPTASPATPTSPAPTGAPRSAWRSSPRRSPAPSTSAPWSSASPCTSTPKPRRSRRVSDPLPADPRRHPAGHPRRQGAARPPLLHPQRHRAAIRWPSPARCSRRGPQRPARPSASSSASAGASLQAASRPAAQGRHAAHRAPEADRYR